MKPTLKIVIAVGLLGLIVWKLGGVREVDEHIFSMNPFYLLPIVLLNIFDRGLMTFKWGLLLRARGINLPLVRAMMIYCASWVWGLFLPTTVGSDAIRAYCTSRDGIDMREVVVSIIIERFIGFLSAMLLVILSLVLLTRIGHLGEWVIAAWTLAGGMLLGTVVLFAVSVNDRVFSLFHDRILRSHRHSRYAQKLREFHETYRSFTVDRRTLLAFLGFTLGEQLLPIATSWLIARGMGIDVSPLSFAAALPLAMFLSRLPISIDGIGVFEGAFVVLMSMAGLSAAQALAIAVVGRILMTITVFPWWAAFVVATRNVHAPVSVNAVRRSGVPEEEG